MARAVRVVETLAAKAPPLKGFAAVAAADTTDDAPSAKQAMAVRMASAKEAMAARMARTDEASALKPVGMPVGAIAEVIRDRLGGHLQVGSHEYNGMYNGTWFYMFTSHATWFRLYA